MNAQEQSSTSSEPDRKSTDGPVPDESPQLHQVELDPDIEQNPGVARVEALHRHLSGPWRWMLYLSIAALAYVYALDQNTTSNYLPYATSSFGQHSFIGTIGTAGGIISKLATLFYVTLEIKIALAAVGKPCIAKIAVLLHILSFVIFPSHRSQPDSTGYILVASAQTVYSVAGGMILHIVGHTGLDIIIADITPLKWRGFATALPSAPFILNAFISAEIVSRVVPNGIGWRWGYGILNERRRIEGSKGAVVPRQPLWIQIKDIAIKMDLFGLVLIGFIFGLILFPISLAKTVNRGWANPSIITMIVVGAILIPVFIIWERFLTPVAIMPRRIANRAFLCAVGIDFFYYFSGFLRSLYLSSFVWVVKNWNTRQWVYFNNTTTITLCVFGLIAGLILHYTGRYKVWTQILIGVGGAFSVVGSRVGSQASVPHEDLASVIALLSLWSSLGTSVGSATATAIWTSNMPDNLVKYLPGVPAATIKKLYGSIKSARNAAPEIRAGVTQGKPPWNIPASVLTRVYSVQRHHSPNVCRRARAVYVFLCRQTRLLTPLAAFISLILAFFTPNFFLGNTHNAVDGKNVAGERTADATIGTSSTPINQRAEEGLIR
ncbi:hypothetical protein FRC10_000112 [Ceratobasidium sp. 414]|nr:hypothetical protein FRC10_000112 [Ceratobasidium sp. 414]